MLNSSLKILMPFSEECYSFFKVICHTTLIKNKNTMYFYLIAGPGE